MSVKHKGSIHMSRAHRSQERASTEAAAFSSSTVLRELLMGAHILLGSVRSTAPQGGAMVTAHHGRLADETHGEVLL